MLAPCVGPSLSNILTKPDTSRAANEDGNKDESLTDLSETSTKVNNVCVGKNLRLALRLLTQLYIFCSAGPRRPDVVKSK